MPKQPAPAKTPSPTSAKPPFKGADVGVNLLACLLIAGGLGYGVDVWLGSKPWGLLLGMALGFAAWLRTLWALFKST